MLNLNNYFNTYSKNKVNDELTKQVSRITIFLKSNFYKKQTMSYYHLNFLFICTHILAFLISTTIPSFYDDHAFYLHTCLVRNTLIQDYAEYIRCVCLTILLSLFYYRLILSLQTKWSWTFLWFYDLLNLPFINSRQKKILFCMSSWMTFFKCYVPSISLYLFVLFTYFS